MNLTREETSNLSALGCVHLLVTKWQKEHGFDPVDIRMHPLCWENAVAALAQLCRHHHHAAHISGQVEVECYIRGIAVTLVPDLALNEREYEAGLG